MKKILRNIFQQHKTLFFSVWVSVALCVFSAAVSAELIELSVQDLQQDINVLLEEKFKTANYSQRGADTCLACHNQYSDKDATGIFSSGHGRVDIKDGPFQRQECETCHGPIGEHATWPEEGQVREPMVTFGENSPVSKHNQNSVCLNCHQDDHNKTTWLGSAHQSNDVGCTSCHTLHQGDDKVRDKTDQYQVCTSCHQERKMDKHKRSNHMLGEGLYACSSCHNPHGTLNQNMLIQPTINQTCTECHTEKRGPFLNEHAPVAEDCALCHSPHSSNERYLLKQRMPFLCKNCHVGQHQNVAGNVGSAINGKSCLNCHSDIHGGNQL
ncbi:DmsE family decaheme c-type cytochrome [Pelagibaculum spongiae]|uniref:Cystathionine beta-synthase n=1 Tax=Pelagibaculum spongiae TaxID=2080658 RepID=A0A2V1GX51_9GAMM|nr:DmsE family decaheme c-type cytochrome [Pelagibaculum spongiae]PVZ68834.1 cystathionine beta-synthase [Pelagibaculum spongiae]